MNPTTVRETHRIMAVLDDLVEDLEILSRLPLQLSAMPQHDVSLLHAAFRDTASAGEVQSQLVDHFDAERRVDAAIDGGATEDDIDALHLSTRALVDTLRAAKYPTTPTAVEPGARVVAFGGIVGALRGLLHDRFHTTVEDDVMKFVILNDTVNREKTASADVQALNREYHNERESRRVEVEKRRVAIRKLQEEQDAVQQRSEVELHELLAVVRTTAAANEEQFGAVQEELEQEVERSDAALRSIQSRNHEGESQLRNTRTKREKELREIVRHYDKEMNALLQATTQLSKELDDDTEQLQQVDVVLSALQEEQRAFEAERLNDEQCRAHREKIQLDMHESARIIQAHIRAYTQRQLATKGKKKPKRPTT